MRFGSHLDYETSDLYYRAKIAMLTGWTMEYIDALGMLDYESIIQVFEAEIMAANMQAQ